MTTQFETGYTYYCSEFGGFSFELGDEIESGKRMIKIDWYYIAGSGDGVIYLTDDNTTGFVMVNNGCRAYCDPTLTGNAYVKVTPANRVPSHLLNR